MNGNMKKAIVVEILAFLFMLLFFYAAINKILDYQKFTVQIGQSPLLTGFGGSIPWLVISTEILISFLLILPRLRLIGFFAAFSLMTMFTTYIWVILNFSSSVPCSCGGILEKLGWTEHLVFNSVFVALGVVGIVLQAQVIKEVKTNNIAETQNSIA
jgi:hypothetical protein